LFETKATAGGILVGLSLIAIGLLGFKVGSRGKAEMPGISPWFLDVFKRLKPLNKK